MSESAQPLVAVDDSAAADLRTGSEERIQPLDRFLRRVPPWQPAG
jgi:hypothetical protein